MALPQIPGVVLRSELGRGAHSIVFRGEQDGRPCAVKLPQTRARWTRWIYREAVSLARVRHKGLPAVLEVGEVDGLPYLVMELVEGEQLAEQIQAGPLKPAEVVAIATQLAGILAAVHDAGLVHRDVKPRNIVVGDGGALKLVDFGFTTPMERTGTGETAGSAAYAAPEQLCPPGRVDGRSDLYGLGRVLFECLVGPDFSKDRAWAAAGEERALLLRRDVPGPLVDVIGHLLERVPAARYQDAVQLLDDLQRITDGQPPHGPSAVRHVRHLAAPVARAAELEELRGVLRAADRGRLVTLFGRQGSGKSRIVEAAERSTRPFARTVSATCTTFDAPLATLRRIVDACWCDHAGDETAIPATELKGLLGNLLPIAALLSGRLGRFLGIHADDLPEASDAVSEGAAEIVLRLARRLGRLAIFVDDVHWIDLVSAEVLARVAHRIGEAPLALVLSGRRDGDGTGLKRLLRAADEASPHARIELAPLDESGVARLVSAHLGVASVDGAAVARIAATADGTPLGVLEVLNAFLDVGALRPHARQWVYDAARVDDAALPPGALALLGARLDDVPVATRRVLEAAAVCGASFTESRVAAVLDLDQETVAYALVDARRAGILEAGDDEGHRFVHESLRDRLQDGLKSETRCRHHQRAGELLAKHASASLDDLCAAARHLAKGEPDRDPAFTHRIAAAAAAASLSCYDEEAALEFHAQAERSARLAGLAVEPELHRIAAEAMLRRGLVAESVAAFQLALDATSDPLARATILGRMAWAHETDAEPERAWRALERAFEAIGHRLPVEDVASAAETALHLARAKVGKRLELRPARSTQEIDLLCRLHYQNARLAFEYGKVGRAVQSSLVSYALMERAESASVRARAQALYAFFAAAFGRPAAGLRDVEAACDLAQRSGDPTTAAFCTQMDAMAKSVTGRFDDAIDRFRELVDTYGPWTELAEYCLHVMSGEIMITMRGQEGESWRWLEKALARVQRSQTMPRTSVALLHRARAALAASDRRVEPESWLAAQLESVPVTERGDGFHRVVCWGPRARYFLETRDFGPAFESLVSEFDAQRYSPRTVNPVVGEYYVVLAHVRLEQCFDAAPAQRAPRVAALARAASALAAASRTELVRAHVLLMEGCIASFRGHDRKATKLLSEAEAIASRQNAPWVLSAVAHARARFLLVDGRTEAALDQARVAETLAREHGAAARARHIREAFALVAVDTGLAASASSRRSASSRTNRQLAALLHVAKRPRRDLKAEQLAASVIDELLRTLDGERGAIWFQPEVPSAGTAVTRHRRSDASVSIAADSPFGVLLRAVHRSGRPWPDPSGATPEAEGLPFDPARTLVVPLYLYEQPVGALSMERASGSAPFAPEDLQLLELLAHQVPIALEIARLLYERELLHASLQQAKKMEAIGQLAGGVAHDFNNMLAAMKVALSVAQERAASDDEMAVELDIIAQATTRAAQLTGQLLSFSRNQPLNVSVQDVNQLVAGIEPMLRRVASDDVRVTLKLSPVVDAVEVDPASFDQALMNLLINARDAMPRGGAFTIATRNVVLDEHMAVRANVTPGAYVEVEVSDTGEGMSQETLARIFEPFFTTKPHGRGTGLGLATVYSFTRNCGGGIEVWSEPGEGTKFRLYFKRADLPRPARPNRRRVLPSVVPAPGAPPDTILVVDDDDLVRRSIAKILERNGYRVVSANGSAEALDVARAQGKRIGLVIMDVLLPGVTGPELGRRLGDLILPAKLLFVSGFSADSAAIEDAKVSAEMLLQKPFSQSALLDKVRKLMPS